MYHLKRARLVIKPAHPPILNCPVARDVTYGVKFLPLTPVPTPATSTLEAPSTCSLTAIPTRSTDNKPTAADHGNPLTTNRFTVGHSKQRRRLGPKTDPWAAIQTTPPQTYASGIACTLSVIHYMLDSRITKTDLAQRGTRFALDTGAHFNVMRRNVQSHGWQDGIYSTNCTSRLQDENWKPVDLHDVVWITMSLGKLLFRINFIVAEIIAVESIVGTAFRNRHVDAILSREQTSNFRKGTIPIVGQGRICARLLGGQLDSFA